VEEPDTQSFIVKIWLEETVEATGRARWRGHITHAMSGERRYLESLSSIGDFIGPYLERWGVKFGILSRLRFFLVYRTGLGRGFKKSTPKSFFF